MKKNVLLLLLVLTSLSLFSQNTTFKNPVIRGDMADPSLIRIDDTYYATATSSEWAPHYPMFESKDLVNWTQIGHVFNKKPEWTSHSFWAPELFYHNNKIYCYYTARRKSDNVSYIGVATANSPYEEFTDHGLLVEYGTEAIDAFVYGDNGQLYISWKAYGLDDRPIEIIASKLSDDGLRLIGEPFTLLRDDEGIAMEGQYHFKHGDYYYIIYSPFGCCGPHSDYAVSVARSKNIEGPYEKHEHNPILQGNHIDFVSCGHGTGVTTPDGRLFYLCHAYLTGEGFYGGRQPILLEIGMSQDEWPFFITGRTALIEQPMPFPNTTQKEFLGFNDSFDSKELKMEWTWNFPFSEVKTQTKKGKLLLAGTPKENNQYGSALCLRPQAPNYSYEVLLLNTPNNTKGLTLYGDNENLIIWGVTDNRLQLRMIKDNKETITYDTACKEAKVYLKIEVEKGCMLRFSVSNNGKKWTRIHDTPHNMEYLVRWDRVARPGLIHIGESNHPAIYDDFILKNY